MGRLLLGIMLCAAYARGQPLRVWCVGDSITQRYAPVLGTLEPAWSVSDFGVGGERSDAGRVRLGGLLGGQAPRPDVVIVFFGTNDVVADVVRHEVGYGASEAAANVRDMVAAVRASGARALVGLPVGAPPPERDDPPEALAVLRALRGGLRRLRARLRHDHPRAVIDFRLTRHELFADIVHPTAAGSEVLARRAARAVMRSTGVERRAR